MAAHTTLAACWQYDRKGVGAPLRREKVDA
jgi:hypothetical protein